MFRLWSVLALVLAALSLGPSFAHVLEAPPRLDWPASFWIDATVRHGAFAFFRLVGGPIDVLAILAAAALARVLRGHTGGGAALAGTLFLALALGAWFLRVAPANTVLAGWAGGGPVTDFEAVRLRWETGHMAVAVLKLLGFLVLALAVAARARRPAR